MSLFDSLDTCHDVSHDDVVWIGGFHLAVHILQYRPDELDDSNDEAAQSNGAQMIPDMTCKQSVEATSLKGKGWVVGGCMG